MTQYEISPDTQAALLLTSRLRQSEAGSEPPLTPSEYVKVVEALEESALSPADLMEESCLSRFIEAGAPNPDRIGALIGRGLALALAVEKWAAQAIWVVGWSDADYPECYKNKLKGQAPPVLYGIGDKSLLGQGGLAIVGSRDVDERGIVFAQRVAETCSDHGVQVVSGGARGVDSEAMVACLSNGGQAVGVLSDGLERYAVSGRFREGIVGRSLVLVSPFEPESRFMIGSAMARNKLIYALADYALVVSSDYKTGGTWTGAVENLKKGWTLLFVRVGEDVPEGNIRLQEAGAIGLDEDTARRRDLLEWMEEAASEAAPRPPAKPSTSSQGSLELF